MIFKSNKQLKIRKGFTLIELLVVIVIIGILTTLTTITFVSVRSKSRDVRRISDLKQISSALELYQADHNAYPTLITPGQSLVSLDGTKTYLVKVPSNPTPRAGGACTDMDYQYYSTANKFTLTACLATGAESLSAGYIKMQTDASVVNFGPAQGQIAGSVKDLGPINGLVGWWLLDAVNTTTDLAGSRHAVASTTIMTTSRYGVADDAYLFNSLDSYVHADGYLEVTPTYSLSAWINRNNAISDYGSIVYGANGNGVNRIMVTNLNKLFAQIRINGTKYSLYGTSTIALDTWYHATYVYDGLRQNIYLNGILDSTAIRPTGTMLTGKGGITMGSEGPSTSYKFKGMISDARVYNRDLSADEVLNLYNVTKP